MSDTKDHPESIWKEIAEQLYSALHLCSAELFAQCAEMPRAARYIEMARNAQARFERAAASPKDAPNIVQQTVIIAGADKDKIEQAAKDAGTADGVTATTGYRRAHAATTGYRAHAATTGDWANAATTGHRAHAATTGDWANAATTGYRAHAATTGNRAIAACLGQNGKAKAGPSGCVIVAYLDTDYRPRVCVGYVGEDGIKANTWYRAEGGKLVEAEDE